VGRFVALALVVLVATALAAGAASSQQPPPPQPFVTGVFDPLVYGHPGREQGFQATKAARGTVVRLLVQWRDVAPDKPTMPAGMNPRDNTDPNYRWGEVDAEVINAVAAGLTPILDIFDAPAWATQGRYTRLDLGPINPDPTAFGDFAYATAKRYSGNNPGLPRVTMFQAWNEPNLALFLYPSRTNGEDVAAEWYRNMLNAFAAGVRSANKENIVVGGALAPFSSDVDYSIPPLRFMRELFCLSATLQPTCANPVAFDVWSTHPYTSGGPNHSASMKDDASLGDLPKVKATLDAGFKAGHIKTTSGKPPQFWVTEFSWDSRPPDPQGVPDATLTRWVSEAFYRMWSNGVSLVTWFLIKDNPFPDSYYQSGLYRVDGTPKPMLAAFKFPFVALKVGTGVLIWGRTPDMKPATVLIEKKVGSRWVRATSLNASAVGIFTSTLKVKPLPKTTDVYRARIGSVAAVPFSIGPTKDVIVKPFGVYGPI
jgi:hypothetical protein